MKNKFKNNSGFSLIELIIAMAILAIMMTAICSIMGSSVAGHRKSKAEIRVHTAAQETYNQVTDTIMQAKDVILIGYTSTTEYDFTTPGVNVGNTPDLVYYVKDAAMKDIVIKQPGIYGTEGAVDANVKYFSNLTSTKNIYVKKLIFVTSAEIDESDIGDSSYNSSSTVNEVTDAVFGGKIKIEKDGTTIKAYDTVVHAYTFEENNMYYEKKHSIMTKRNHRIEWNSVDANLVAKTKEQNLYNSGLSYVVTNGGAPVSGCIANVDPDRGAIGVEFQFNDMNMTYTTNGMVNIRNSYILKAREE